MRGGGLVCLLILHISSGLFVTASVLTFPVFTILPPIAAAAVEDIEEI